MGRLRVNEAQKSGQESGHIRWPLFHCLSPEDQVKLMQYQWDTYGYRLEIPPLKLNIGVVYPSLEECERNMKQKPHGMKRVI